MNLIRIRMKYHYMAVFILLLIPVFAFSQNNARQGQSAVTLYNRAYQMQQKEDYYSAIESYREALQINPQYGDAWYNLALCTFSLGEYELAVEYSDTASRYAHNLSDIQNLKGLSLIALGRIQEANDVFNAVLKKYPNDINARFGLAEIDLYNGSISAAERRYLDALKRDPNNRKALLSLALVTAEDGRVDVAERYVNQALEYHSGEAEVHYLASYLAATRGDIKEAERRARSAVQIKGDYDKAYELLADILYAQGRYNDVIDLCDFRIGRNRQLGRAWYLKGLSEERLGLYSQAIDTYDTGLSIDPQDEIMRFALEQLISKAITVEDEKRNDWAQYHLNKAREYSRAFDGPGERYEYQKALSIAPLNITARQLFANMLERDGFYELYLQQLKFIKENEKITTTSTVQKDENTPKTVKTSRQVKNDDTIEALESILNTNLAHKYNIDPFYLNKVRWNIGIYFERKRVKLLHSDAEQIVAQAACDIFNGVPAASVDVQTDAISGFAEAYRTARGAGRDYFIILSVDETERSFSLDATVYSARTGTKATELHIYRTGNDRVSRSIRRLRQAVLDILPIRGTVLNNSLNTLLVDIGKSDGIVKGAQFDIVKKGKIKTADTGTGVVYSDKDVIGTYTVSVVNEEISEGVYKKKGFYDTLNVGDELILVKMPNSTDESVNGNAVTDTRPAADNEGEPATDAAEKAERESIKEDLKSPTKESTLIRMIQNIL